MTVVYGDGQISICGGAMRSNRKWSCAQREVTTITCHKTGSEVTWVSWPEKTLTGSMLCACATRRCAISALVGPFHRKWRQSRDRKRPCPEAVLIASAIGTFSTTTVLQVPWLPVTPKGVKGCAPAQYPSFSTEVGYRKWRHFPPRFFLSSSTKYW